MNRPSQLIILVGTVTGTAEQVAKACELACSDLIEHTQVRLMDGLDIRALEADALYVICTATHGAGDVPDNARALYDSLANEPRFLGQLRYGVIALGDSCYPQTFCHGGLRFDERLSDLGAVRMGDVFQHDASSGTEPELEGAAWCRAWLKKVLSPCAAT